MKNSFEKIFCKLGLLIVPLLFNSNVFAQPTPLDNDSLQYEISIPAMLEVPVNRQKIVYNIPNQEVKVDYQSTPVKPLSFQPNENKLKGSAWLLLGTLQSLDVGASLYSPIKKNGLELLCNLNKTSGVNYQKHTQFLLNAIYKMPKKFKSSELQFAVKTNQQYNYGIYKNMDTSVFDKNRNQLNYDLFSAEWRNTNFVNEGAKQNALYKIGTTFLNGTNASESLLQANYYYQKFAKKDFMWVLKIDGVINAISGNRFTNTLFYAMPSVGLKTEKNNKKYEVGLQTLFTNKETKLLPYGHFKLTSTNLLSHMVIGLKNNVVEGSLKNILQVNPIAVVNNTLEHGYQSNYYAGIVYSINPQVTVSSNLDFVNGKSFDFFVSQNANLERSIVTDFHKVEGFKWNVEAVYQVVEKMEIGANYQYWKNNGLAYSLIPKNLIIAYINATPLPKLMAQASIHIQNGQIGRIEGFSLPKQNLSTYIDLHTQMQYQFAKKWFGLLRINNLLNAKNEQFVGYGSYGINGLVGVRYVFENNGIFSKN